MINLMANSHKILLLSQKEEIKSIDNANNSIVEMSSQSEKAFIGYGMSQSDLASIDMSSEFSKKHYIQDEPAPLGEGKVFKHTLDSNKILKKISVK